MKRLALFAIALIGLGGVAQAQSMGTTYGPVPHSHARYVSGSMAQACGHRDVITDEYGFRYDSMGNRINARGCVIPPPHTLPGAKVIQG